MATRANFTIVTKQGKFKMQSNSSAYPSHMMESIIKFATSTASCNAIFDKEAGIDEKVLGFYPEPESRALSEFIEDAGLTFGSVGNPNYFYEIDFVNRHVKAWKSTSRWINAPADWKEKGWQGLWEGKNGRMGYMDNNVRGKLIYNKTLKELVKEVVDNNPVLHEGVITFAENIG
jgi:hypothetical protein